MPPSEKPSTRASRPTKLMAVASAWPRRAYAKSASRHGKSQAYLRTVSPGTRCSRHVAGTTRLPQFTCTEFISVLKAHEIRISMDGKGRWRDNVFVERLGRSVKYEEVYLHAYGACQATCRFDYAALRLILASSSAVLTSESRSGLSVTTSMGCQLQVCRDQRRGWAARASVYSAWRVDRMSRSSPA